MDARGRFCGLLMMLALFAGITAFGGCVPKKALDDAVAMNHRISEQLELANRQLETMRAENENLKTELANFNARLAAKDTEIARLSAANADLRTQLADLDAKYRELAGREPPTGPDRPFLGDELDKLLREWAAKYPEMVEYDAKRGMVKFKTDLLFPKGSDELGAEAKTTLAKFAEILRGASAANFHVYVAGHTDDIPIRRPETLALHKTNWHLSSHRAIAVVEELFNDGVALNRMGAMGFSKYHPVAPNQAGQRGNPLNRRVEIWIVPPGRFLTVDTGVSVGAETPESPEPPK